MSNIERTIWCNGCGVEIFWAPITIDDHYYCCQECFEGFECSCSERMELEDERQTSENANISLSKRYSS